MTPLLFGIAFIAGGLLLAKIGLYCGRSYKSIAVESDAFDMMRWRSIGVIMTVGGILVSLLGVYTLFAVATGHHIRIPQ